VSGATENERQLSTAGTRSLWWVLFVAGLALSLTMVLRSRFDGDQFNMLARGWTLAFAGEWLQYGMPTSAGGMSPGGLQSLIVGLPLMVWADGRAATLLLWLMGVASYLLLDRTFGRRLGPQGRLLFALVYWLNPWRMHYTSILWNSSYMFFFGAVHAWCAVAMRHGRRFWPSLLMALCVGLGLELHTAALALAFASVLLWWRGVIKVDWWGVAAGSSLVVASIVPWILVVSARPDLLPGGPGFPFRNLVLVLPMLRGLIYLLRYSSLALPERVYELDLAPGATADDLASAVLRVLLVALGWLTVLLPVLAYRRFLGAPRALWRRLPAAVGDRQWLRRYALWTLAGAMVAFAVSPTSVMFWQGFPVVHAAVLPVVLFAEALVRSGRIVAGRRALVAAVATMLAVNALIGWASPMFRAPGPLRAGASGTEASFVRRLSADHPMFHDLGLHDRCGLVIVDQGGWMPDLWRERPAAWVEEQGKP
jgi:hypothetical protein